MFRELRSQLLMSQFQKTSATQTGCCPKSNRGDGAKFYAANLAISLPPTRIGILILIDADLRNPEISLVILAALSQMAVWQTRLPVDLLRMSICPHKTFQPLPTACRQSSSQSIELIERQSFPSYWLNWAEV